VHAAGARGRRGETTLAALIEWLRERWRLSACKYIPTDGRSTGAYGRAAAMNIKPVALDGMRGRCCAGARTARRTSTNSSPQGAPGAAPARAAAAGAGDAERRSRSGRRGHRPLDRRIPALEASGWKGKEGTAMICTEANRRFLTETFAAAYSAGGWRWSAIDLDGKPLGRCTGFIAGEGSFAFKPAYDEAFAKFSPGIIAEVARIRNLHELPGVRWMDSFTDAGNSMMSRLWKDRMTVQTLAFGTGAAGSLAIAALPFLRWAKQQGKRALSAASRARAPAKPAQPPAPSAA
jgi:hypothetical protein